MLFLYNSAGICAYQQPFQCDLHYIPQLKDIMAKSRDWDELQHTWVEYHRKAGRGMRDSYEQLIDVMQEVAYVNSELGYHRNQKFKLKTLHLQMSPMAESTGIWVTSRVTSDHTPKVQV